jgi:hypothetical protein
MDESTAREDARLFKPRDTVRFRTYERADDEAPPGYNTYMMTGPVTVAFRPRETPTGTKTRDFLDAGKNPPGGVIIHYTLKEKPEGEVKLNILDAFGQTIRSFSSVSEDPPHVPAEAGANRFIWNLRYDKPTPLEGDQKKKSDFMAKMMEEGAAPRAVPGDYQAQLVVGDSTLTQPFTVQPDPRLTISIEDFRAQYDLKVGIRDRVSEVHEMINALRRLHKQVAAWEERTKPQAEGEKKGSAKGGSKGGGKGGERVREAAIALKGKLKALEGELTNIKPDDPRLGPAMLKEKLAILSLMIDESDDPPTQAAWEVYKQLSEQVETWRAALQQLRDEDVHAFNELVQSSGIPAVGV